jgi:inosose dehydratase
VYLLLRQAIGSQVNNALWQFLVIEYSHSLNIRGPMTIEFAVAPIAWTNDDLPELGSENSLEKCLSETRLAGFTGTELGGKFPKQAEELGAILDEYQLKLASGWFSGQLLNSTIEEEKKRVSQQLNTFLALDVPVMVYAETTGSVQSEINTPLSQRPQLSDDALKAYAEKLTAFAEFMQSEGMPLSYHHHMGTIVENEHDVDRLMAYSGDSLGLLVDTGHCVFAGIDPTSLIEKYSPRINHVHMKDIRKPVLEKVKQQDFSFLNAVLEGVFTVPGDGFIDYQQVAAALKQIDYSGWVVIEAEQDPAKACPLEYSKKGRAHLQNVFQRAGFTVV